jgi:hypothetical protein
MSNEKDVMSFFPDGSLKVSDMAPVGFIGFAFD